MTGADVEEDRAASVPQGRPVRVYRLVVEYPPGALDGCWQPSSWDPYNDDRDSWTPAPDEGPVFRWPQNRLCLSPSTAARRANLFVKYGAKVTIEPSDAVTWPTPPADEGGGA